MSNVIKAKPTKGFFIDMLTRDIPLGRAIVDLIDNSIDGAKNLRKEEDYRGLNVGLKLSADQFEIIDNCGGFDLNTAKEYAFRFGRPEQAKFVDHSIGRFGVGMKRALFKMGRHFMVESMKGDDHFLVEVDVDEWLKKPDDEWDFTFVEKADIPEHKRKLKSDGTVVTLSRLYENISSEFSSDVFLNELEKGISLALNFSLLKGLTVLLNDKIIERKDISFLWADDLRPYFKVIYPLEDVEVKIYCGIGEPSPSIAGWYIFCNDRLVLESDKSYTTGWKQEKEDDGNIIKYHNKYAMFRGVVTFNSIDSMKLPMTTTKTGIDSDHAIFKATRPEMLLAMKQVLGFLGKIDDKEIRDSIVRSAKSVSMYEVKDLELEMTAVFKSPDIQTAKTSNGFGSISYYRSVQIINTLKEYFSVSTNREVGEKTFDYFINMNKGDL